MERTAIRTMNAMVTALVAVGLLIVFLYAGLALWDNHQIYHSADAVLDEMKEIKARMAAQAKADEEEAALLLAQAQAEAAAQVKADAEKAKEQARALRAASYSPYGAPFEELKAINDDVVGWITVPNTGIDYPVVQGETNSTYINKDVYKKFAMAGSIFLDSRNEDDFVDVYNLLYGHNMSKHRMFSDVNLFKDQAFFEANQTAELYLQDKKHTLMSISCFLVRASDWALFYPEHWEDLSAEDILKYAVDRAMYVSQTGLDALKQQLEAGEQPRFLALSTCSEEFTDARTILLMLILP